MTYRPTEEFFGPPFSQRVPSLVHLMLALGLLILVLAVRNGPRDSRLYGYLFLEPHLLSTEVTVGLFLMSAIASALRAGMRGVRVRSDWVEYRDLLGSFVPKVRRIRWAQIDRLNLGDQLVTLELWDGTRDTLPKVRDLDGLARTLERVAIKRAIVVSGGRGVDDWADLSSPGTTDVSE
jgi:hypothetical protein